MTRGKIIIFHNDGIISSIEFNGDMYYEDGHGIQVFDELKNVNTVEEYEAFVERFNNENFMYNDEELTYNPLVWNTEEELLDMRTDYFGKWFSDYLYFKNLRDEDVVITDDENKVITIQPSGVLSLNFGTFNEDCVQLNVDIKMPTLIEIITPICEKLDWKVGDDNGLYELEKYSHNGEDFVFSVQAVDLEQFIKEVCDYANGFDDEEHAVMLYQSGGYNLRTLLNDAEEIQNMLDELAEELEKLIK